MNVHSLTAIFGRQTPVCEVSTIHASDRGNGLNKRKRGAWRREMMRAAVLLMAAGCVSAAMEGATYVQANSSAPPAYNSTVRVSYPAAEAAGDLNVVVVGWNDNSSEVQSITDSAGNLYRLAIGPTAGNGVEQSIYYAPNIAGGSDTVTVEFNQAANYPDVRVMEYAGVASLDVTAGKHGNSSTTGSGAATTTAANELIVASNTVATWFGSAGKGYTVRVRTADSDIVEDKTAASAGSNNATATLGQSGPWVMQMAAFAPGTMTAQPAALGGMTCSAGSLTGAGTDACTVTLTGAAPSGGLTVGLASSSGAMTVPAAVTVGAGATSATFTAAAAAVSTSQSVTLTASASGAAKSFSVELNAVVPGLTLSTASLAFGNVTLNSEVTRTVTLESTGTAAVTISGATVTGAGFSASGMSGAVTLNPGQTAVLTVAFDPTAAGSAAGTIALSDDASPGTATISLSGTGMAAAALNGITCGSGSLTGAGTDACTVTLTATAPSGGLTVALASSSSAVTVPASVTVAAGGSAAGFSATAAAVSTAQTATLTASAGGMAKSFALQLNAATPALTAGTTSLGFGDVDLNSAATQTVTLTSTGTAAVTLNGLTVAGTGFSVSGVSTPLTLKPGQTATLDVEFDPTTAGAATGTVTLSDNGTPGTATISLSGTGNSTAYQVELNWQAPSGSADPVVGYNVYRETAGGSSYQLVNSDLCGATSYTDTTVKSGTNYVYYVVSVDAEGTESSPSSTYAATIP